MLPRECQATTFSVPTYHGATAANEADESRPEFAPPDVEVLVYRECGLRVIMGVPQRDLDDCPDIKLERRPNGWAIFLHPEPNGDPSGYVYFLDDGRSILLTDRWPTTILEIRGADESVPEVDEPGK